MVRLLCNRGHGHRGHTRYPHLVNLDIEDYGAVTMLQQTLVILSAIGIAVGMILDNNNKKQRQIMAKLSELAGQLEALETGLAKVHAEVEALKNSLEDVEIPAEAQASLDRLSAAVTALDELNPDNPDVEPDPENPPAP